MIITEIPVIDPTVTLAICINMQQILIGTLNDNNKSISKRNNT